MKTVKYVKVSNYGSRKKVRRTMKNNLKLQNFNNIIKFIYYISITNQLKESIRTESYASYEVMRVMNQL